MDIATWNASDRLFHRQLAAMTGNPVLLAFADHVATLMDQPLWQRLRDDSIAVRGPHAHPRRRAPHDLRGDRRRRRRRRRLLLDLQHINRVRAYMELS